MTHYKVVISGSVGAGKSTAVRTVSLNHLIATEVPLSASPQTGDKTGTTVAMDYGTYTDRCGRDIVVYGTPGQDHLSFMWGILGAGAQGILVLLHAATAQIEHELERYVDEFSKHLPDIPVMIALTHADQHTVQAVMARCQAYLADHNISADVMDMDARDASSVRACIHQLLRF